MSSNFWENSAGGLFRSLGSRAYRHYFFGQAFSLLGTWMQHAALGWLAFSFHQQSRWPAWVQAAQLLPSVIIGPIAGMLIDRVPKRALILSTQAILIFLALVLATAEIMDWLDPTLLILWAVVSGMVMAVDLPARLSYLVDLVGRESLPNAVALNSFAFNLARALGPSLAAALLWRFGVEACFLLNALSYSAVIFALWGNNIPGEPHPRPVGGNLVPARIPPNLLGMIALAGVVSCLGWPVLALCPGYAAQVLLMGPTAYSLVVGAIGLGALGACGVVATEKTAGFRGVRMGASMLCVAVGLLTMGMVNQLFLSLIGALLVGLGMVGFMATAQTVIQMGAPPELRGRILGTWTATLSGALPLGNFVAGPLADAWGVDWVLRAMGLGIFVAWAVWTALSARKLNNWTNLVQSANNNG